MSKTPPKKTKLKSEWLSSSGITHLILFLLILIVPVKAQQPSGAKEAVVLPYETKFGQPAFLPGNLAGQEGWWAVCGRSQDAAKIVPDGTGQHLVISGEGIQLEGPANYSGAYRKAIQLDPGASESPCISASADFQLNLNSSDSKVKALYAFLIIADENGRDIESIGIDVKGTVFGQNWATPNQVVVAPIKSANVKHSLRVDFDFATRKATFYMDKLVFGSLGFNSGVGKLPRFVDLVLQSSAPISSILTISSLSVTRK